MCISWMNRLLYNLCSGWIGEVRCAVYMRVRWNKKDSNCVFFGWNLMHFKIFFYGLGKLLLFLLFKWKTIKCLSIEKYLFCHISLNPVWHRMWYFFSNGGVTLINATFQNILIKIISWLWEFFLFFIFFLLSDF